MDGTSQAARRLPPSSGSWERCTHQALGPQAQVGGEQEDVALVALAEQLAAGAKHTDDDGGVLPCRGAGAAEDQVGHRAADLLHDGLAGRAVLRQGRGVQ